MKKKSVSGFQLASQAFRLPIIFFFFHTLCFSFIVKFLLGVKTILNSTFPIFPVPQIHSQEIFAPVLQEFLNPKSCNIFLVKSCVFFSFRSFWNVLKSFRFYCHFRQDAFFPPYGIFFSFGRIILWLSVLGSILDVLIFSFFFFKSF